MYKNRSQGFTLIELLVVIAIIGILSAVVLAALNTARTKGNDAATESNLQTIMTQAALDYSGVTPNGYGTTANPFYTEVTTPIAAQAGKSGAAPVFPTAGTSGTDGDPTVGSAINQIINNAGGVYFGSNGTSWEVLAPLKAVTGAYWCVDSNGSSREVTTAVTSSNYGSSSAGFTCAAS